jgi:hypothetical protein
LIRQGSKQKIQVAEETPFDNSVNDFVSNNVQGALEEVGASASPGFSFGRSANVSSGTWLLRTGSIPSNKTGIPVGVTSPFISNIQIGNEDSSTFNISIYEHEGDEINLTLLATVSVTAARTAVFSVNIPVTSGRQLAALLSSGSGKNVGVDLIIKGST